MYLVLTARTCINLLLMESSISRQNDHFGLSQCVVKPAINVLLKNTTKILQLEAEEAM